MERATSAGQVYLLLALFFASCGCRESCPPADTTGPAEKAMADAARANAEATAASKESALQACVSRTKELESSSSSCEAQKAELSAKLEAYTQSPAGIYRSIISKSAELRDSASAESLLSEVNSFMDRFPGTAEAKALRGKKTEIEASRKHLLRYEQEQAFQAAVSGVRGAMGSVEDGSELAVRASALLAAYFDANSFNFDMVSRLPRSNYEEAMKDPDGSRGKSLIAKGEIIQIEKDGQYFIGLMAGGQYGSKIFHFITSGRTDGIVQGRHATFAGAIVQRYSYSNAGGGTTHSLSLVGYFNGQK